MSEQFVCPECESGVPLRYWMHKSLQNLRIEGFEMNTSKYWLLTCPLCSDGHIIIQQTAKYFIFDDEIEAREGTKK